MSYTANDGRYKDMLYRRCGRSGLKLPAVSLGLWHNFGDGADQTVARDILCRAFDRGVTHFDIANNYGPPYGSAERNFGKIYAENFRPYRDELIISSKAGYDMWAGPYGEWGSKKYLTASLDQSLTRTGLDYFDIFYHHRPDPDTDIEETACALDLFVKQGKALYIGVSNYSAEQTAAILKIFRELYTPFIIHQPRYNMADRWIENGLTDVLKHNGVGAICFSPLAQGLLTDRYLKGIPSDSRAAHSRFLSKEQVGATIEKIRKLDALAKKRGQTLAQTAVAWILHNDAVTSVLIGASKVSQLDDNIDALKNLEFLPEELSAIDSILDGVRL